MENDTGQLDSFTAYAASKLRSRDTVETVRADLLARGIAPDRVDSVIREARAGNRQRGVRAGAIYLGIGIACLVLTGVISDGTDFAAIGLFGFGIGYTIGGVVRLIRAASTGN